MNDSHRDRIEQTRLENMSRSLSLRRQQQRDQPLATTPTYVNRDNTTGLRQLEAADGGKIYGRYLSNARPEAIVLLPGSLGRDAIVLQKPA
jgi:hypothetical protein